MRNRVSVAMFRGRVDRCPQPIGTLLDRSQPHLSNHRAAWLDNPPVLRERAGNARSIVWMNVSVLRAVSLDSPETEKFAAIFTYPGR